MFNRRAFIKKAVATSMVPKMTMAYGFGSKSELPERVDPRDEAKGLFDQEKIIPKGSYFDATVPDTLDLAERAKLCVNVLTQNMEPSEHYAVYQVFRFGHSPFQLAGLTWNLPGKNARALPLMRAMCGSDFNLDTESKLMAELLSNVDANGMIYYPIANDGAPKGTYYPPFGGILCQALANWYGRDGNPAWLKQLAIISSGLSRLAIQVAGRGYAYYPTESGIDREGKWHFTARGNPAIAYTPPDEPISDQQGLEGSVKWDDGSVLVGLVLDYKLNGNQRALETAGQIARFLLKPSLYQDTSSLGYPGNEHGIFAGHFHGNTQALCALLDYATMANDGWVKQIVREGYDNACRYGVMRMGWFPAWIASPGEFKYVFNSMSTPDDIPMMLVKLSDAGVGDYWDDLDYILRNHFTEQQFIDLSLMREISEMNSQNDALLQRFWGGYTQGGLTQLAPVIFGGNTAVFSQALYYAWEGITRCENGIATVNLLLNRVSAWMDIDSYIPYEGKVVLRNKTARTALIRIPSWIRLDDVRSFVNERPINAGYIGRYLIVEKLQPRDEIRIEFSITEHQDEYTIHEKKLRVLFRGSTVIDIQPRDTGFVSPHDSQAKKYPLYQRSRFRSYPAPRKQVKRFVAERLIPLY